MEILTLHVLAEILMAVLSHRADSDRRQHFHSLGGVCKMHPFRLEVLWLHTRRCLYHHQIPNQVHHCSLTVGSRSSVGCRGDAVDGGAPPPRRSSRSSKLLSGADISTGFVSSPDAAGADSGGFAQKKASASHRSRVSQRPIRFS